MDDLREAERFRVAQEEALARVRANPANPPVILPPSPHSSSSSHPSNPNTTPLQPPSLSPSPHSNSSPHHSNPNTIPLQPPPLPDSDEGSSNAPDHLLEETTAFSFIGHQELRQSLENQVQETSSQADLAAENMARVHQEIADTETAHVLASQDSSSSIVAFTC